MTTIGDTESLESEGSTKQHSFKKPATYIGYGLVAPMALYAVHLAQTTLVPFASADMNEFQMRVLMIVFFLSFTLGLIIKRQALFVWLVCRFKGLRKFKSYDENKHRRVYKAMMFQSGKATIKQVFIMWGLFLGVHLLIAFFGGLSIGWTFAGDFSTYAVFGATAIANLSFYGYLSYLRLRREQEKANDPYHGSEVPTA